MSQDKEQPNSLQEQNANCSKGDAFKKNYWRIFYGDFWANHPVAVLGLVVGTIFVAPIVNFPGGTERDAKYVCIGFSVFLCTAIYWFVSGFLKLNKPTEDEISEEFRKLVESKLEGVNARLGSVDTRLQSAEDELAKQRPLRLTSEQKNAITKAMSQFPGQVCSVQISSANNETMMLGQDLYDAILAAGCKTDLCGLSTFIPNFCVRLHVNPCYSTQVLPPALKTMMDCLESLELSNHIMNITNDVPVNEMLLRVGTLKDPLA